VKDFSDEQVNDQIYPIWTYASLVCLLVVAFISEIFRFLNTDVFIFFCVLADGGLKQKV